MNHPHHNARRVTVTNETARDVAFAYAHMTSDNFDVTHIRHLIRFHFMVRDCMHRILCCAKTTTSALLLEYCEEALQMLRNMLWLMKVRTMHLEDQDERAVREWCRNRSGTLVHHMCMTLTAVAHFVHEGLGSDARAKVARLLLSTAACRLRAVRKSELVAIGKSLIMMFM